MKKKALNHWLECLRGVLFGVNNAAFVDSHSWLQLNKKKTKENKKTKNPATLTTFSSHCLL